MKTALSLDQFRTAFRAGGLRSISLTATGGQFFVVAIPRAGDPITLATTHGKKVRAFRNPARAIEILHAMGAHKVEVDTTAWSPAEAGIEARKRPDTAERQRRAHEAAAHDAWFRSEVELGLREVDDPGAEWFSQEDMKRQSQIKRAEWLGHSKPVDQAVG